MVLATVNVLKNNSVIICCPFCEAKRRVRVDKFKDIKHRIAVRCKCDNRFEVQFNFRKSYRKSVSILGEYRKLPPDIPTERAMKISDLSRNGLRFQMLDPVVVKKGDRLLVTFNLDDRKQTPISKKVIVRYANKDIFGCEFTELSMYEKELGFYLMAQ
jgi:hypothetical protein